MVKVRVLLSKMQFYGLLFRFCENTKKNPTQLLKNASNHDLKIFLQWIIDNYPSRKRTSIRQKYKHWRQLYRKYAEKDWPKDVNEEINDVWKSLQIFIKSR